MVIMMVVVVVVVVVIPLRLDQLGRSGGGFRVGELKSLDGVGDRLQEFGIGGGDGDGAGLSRWRGCERRSSR
jgi:hypothetical protein